MKSSSRRAVSGFAWVLMMIGFVALILAAREHAWSLGHWSQDVSPVPLLVGIALVSTALDRVGALAGVGAEESGTLASDSNMRRWQHLGIAFTAVGLAMLGRSGLALLIAALMTCVLFLLLSLGPHRVPTRAAKAIPPVP